LRTGLSDAVAEQKRAILTNATFHSKSAPYLEILAVKLHLAENQGQQRFTGYGAGYVTVNNVRYERSVVVSPQSVSEWPVGAFEGLTAADFAFIAALKVEIVIFGTGAVQRFPRPELSRALAATGAGVEVMDSKAACRTYNILAAEGRKVAAAVLID
jgi:uncharacterized protein